MEPLLQFARGPLFRLCFGIMLLGLGRIFFLDLWGARKAYLRAGDKKMPWKLTISRSLEWLFPFKRVFNNRQVYSIFSILFHTGLIIVPIFLYAHIDLWKNSVGISWPALPYWWAFGLTVSTIVFAFALLIERLVVKSIHSLSRGEDYWWLILLLIPFVTGLICANVKLGAGLYRFLMLVHVLSADLIFVSMPFTKIAHCVLAPFSQLVDAIAWKFPAKTDDDIGETLGKKGARV